MVDHTSMHTKRPVLSKVTYEATCVMALVVMVFKLFIQDLWTTGLLWDVELDVANIAQRLTKYWATLYSALAGHVSRLFCVITWLLRR